MRQLTAQLLLALLAGAALARVGAQMAPFAPLAGPATDETVGELETTLFPPPASASRRSPPGKASSRTPPAEPDAETPSMPPLLQAGGNAKPPAGKAPTSTVQPTDNCLTAGLAEAGLTAMLAAVKKAGLSSTFQGLDNVTLLAPTDEAFEAFDPTVTVGLLRTFLYYHVVEGSYSRSSLPGKSLTTMLSDAEAVTTCGGSGKGTLDVKTAGSSTLFEGGASSAGLKEADISMCDGAVTVHIITQVLQPCCANVKALLKGATSSSFKPIMLNTTKKADADIKIFQDTLYANATDDKKTAKAVFVPTAAAWERFDIDKVLSAASMEGADIRKNKLLRLLALYHMSYDKMSLTQLTTGVESQSVVVSVLGKNSVENPTCPQRIRMVYRASVVDTAPTFVVASDDQKTSGKVVGYYQTCSGVNVYQIDAVLVPCNFVQLQLIGGMGDEEDSMPPEDEEPAARSFNEPPLSNVSFIPKPQTTRRNSAASAASSALMLTAAAALLGMLL